MEVVSEVRSAASTECPDVDATVIGVIATARRQREPAAKCLSADRSWELVAKSCRANQSILEFDTFGCISFITGFCRQL